MELLNSLFSKQWDFLLLGRLFPALVISSFETFENLDRRF